jgi:hypothetical protein
MIEYMVNGLKYLLGYEPKQTVAEIATGSATQAHQAPQRQQRHVLLLKKNEGYKNVNSNTVLDYVFDVFE